MADTRFNRNPVKKHVTARNSQYGDIGGSILQALPIAAIVFDADLRIVEANSMAASLIEPGSRIDQCLARGTDDEIWQGWTQQLGAVISERKTATFDEVSYTSENGTKLLRIVCAAAEQIQAKGGFIGIAIIEDVSEKAEIQRKLSDAERLAVIGRRAARVAHELNNPLDGILRYINLTMRFVERENLAKPEEYLTQCKQGLMRMVQIIGELLEFSRSTYMPSEHVKIDQVIEDAVKPMEPRASSLNVRISRNYALGLPPVRSGNLFQVFCNLVKNALDAMPEGGELKISTRPAADNTIVVEFRDTGTGLPETGAMAIFEPFFTTKDKDGGTGLGLSICRDIIESYRGRITAENAPGRGAIFTVYLPAGR